MAHPFEDSGPLRWTTTGTPSRVSFKTRRTSSRFKCPPQVLQVITGLMTVSLNLRPLSLEGSNPSFEIFNPPVGPRFLLFEDLDLSFEIGRAHV